jgi:hypothetical protein
MREALEGFGYIARHGEIDSAVDIVPFEMDAQVEVAISVSCHFVLGGNDIEEMLGMLVTNAFDAEVIDHKGERNRA